MKIRLITISPPEKDLPIQDSRPLLAQTLLASASYETAIFTAHSAVSLLGLKVAFDTTLTGAGAGGAGGTLYINLYRAGAKVGGDGGVLTYAFNTGTTAAAFTQVDLGAPLVKVLAKGDVLSAKWLQGATGLALPAGKIEINYGIGGTPRT